MSARMRISRWLDRHPFDIDQWLAGATYVLGAVGAVVLVAFLIRLGPFLIGLLR